MYAQKNYEPPQVVHLYVVPEEEYRDPIDIKRVINRALGLVAMLLLFAIPSGVDISPWSLIVPLEILPVQTLTTTVTIAPTGTNVIPSTNARGTLTVYNGSILVQQLPKGFIVESAGGEIVTDEAVVIPYGNPPSYGVARVAAHSVSAGQAGNVPALAINATYGTSLYLKNLTSFTGGADGRTEAIATDSDKQAALSSARYKLRTQTNRHMLDHPCGGESVTQSGLSLSVSWSCQFVAYTVSPGLHVLSAQRAGDRVVLEVQR
jgi:hypothetical protein